MSLCPASSPSPVLPTERAEVALRPVAAGTVRVTEGFWAQRMSTNRQVTLPLGAQQLESAGNLENLRIAAGQQEGLPRGPEFADSDVYKWLEAAAWDYACSRDAASLEQQLQIVRLLEAAQKPDGYLNAVIPLRSGQRYQNLPWSHEHYCAGHLIQAAVALARSAGRTELLEIAVGLADHMVEVFGPEKNRALDGHPVIESALVELYRETGTRAYLELAAWFVQARGAATIRSEIAGPSYFSDRVPVRQAQTVEGHAVRAMYLAAGAADLAVETGDTELLVALEQQYQQMRTTKQYITGGLGSRWEGESFGSPYELPNERAYAETCAAVGAVQWAWRMLLATGKPVYADQIEHILFNGFLAGVSLEGDKFFYVNPLQVSSTTQPEGDRDPAAGRNRWFDCACCPPNLMRMLASLESYMVTTGSAETGGVQLHQYASGTVEAAGFILHIRTDYPWSGQVQVSIEAAPDHSAAISLRIPAWAAGAKVGGQLAAAGQYWTAVRRWRPGQSLQLQLPMRPRLLYADPRVEAARGSVAVARGPLIYAFESCDQPSGSVLENLVLDTAAPITVEHRHDLLGGVSILQMSGFLQRPRGDDPEELYTEKASASPIGGRALLTAIPYYAWANRGPQAMRVWIPATGGPADGR
ncbi:glycoside hydrolase family 127 protein [Nesterenkonia alkaliphila]|uniref:Glycoside hydrolase family 127 protein n=1 Tax=Nesterenkonia alkaliphila TaxID=1463631 RepID=A0A7K1UH93_9MICC|nr:beta-L-arabinofuranosidase domain-containing protein [Nesterenkonia alkaliphila]MVT25809.1 glycoside hydrolase family 127 protein [Nesterenkonia alkaliphila]GFZ94713.1 hypothetical protein GCM10011359_25210 [Nesterenkonia alkaliphila]